MHWLNNVREKFALTLVKMARKTLFRTVAIGEKTYLMINLKKNKTQLFLYLLKLETWLGKDRQKAKVKVHSRRRLRGSSL